MILGGKEYEGSLDWFITQFQKYSLRIWKFLLPYVACYAQCSVLIGFCEGWETEKMHLMAKMIWTNWRYNAIRLTWEIISCTGTNRPAEDLGVMVDQKVNLSQGCWVVWKGRAILQRLSRAFRSWDLRNDPFFGTYTASAGCSGAFGNCRWKMWINRRRKHKCSENDQDLNNKI